MRDSACGSGGGGDAARPRSDETGDLLADLGRNLRRLRTSRGFSLERFSKVCGVSRGMLGQIETGKSVPTIGVLWKIATALDIPFAQLLAGPENKSARVLRRDGTPIIVSDNGGFQSRPLFPRDSGTRAEFYELRLAPAHKHNSEPHAPGTTENLVVTSGLIEIAFDSGAPVNLSKGDAIFFEADVPHSYRNLEEFEAVLYLVVSYESIRQGSAGGHE